jgi:mRNA interferase HigB
MHVIARRTLTEFTGRHPDAAGPINAWYHEAKAARWNNTAQVKARYPSASIINAERVVFNIAGNKYRLVTCINFASGKVFIRFIGTHAEYDRIKAEKI